MGCGHRTVLSTQRLCWNHVQVKQLQTGGDAPALSENVWRGRARCGLVELEQAQDGPRRNTEIPRCPQLAQCFVQLDRAAMLATPMMMATLCWRPKFLIGSLTTARKNYNIKISIGPIAHAGLKHITLTTSLTHSTPFDKIYHRSHNNKQGHIAHEHKPGAVRNARSRRGASPQHQRVCVAHGEGCGRHLVGALGRRGWHCHHTPSRSYL